MLLSNLSLQKRIGLLVLAGLTVSLALFSWLGIQSVNQSIDTALAERLTTARMMARHLDETLTYVLSQLQNTASHQEALFIKEQFDAEAHSMRGAFVRAQIFTQIALVDKSGKVLYSYPDEPKITGIDVSNQPEVKKVFDTGLPGVSDAVINPLSSKPMVLVTMPVKNSASQTVGVLMSTLDVQSTSGDALEQTGIGKTGYIEIIDGNGSVIAQSQPSSPRGITESSDHPVRFSNLIARNEATVGTCHRCHESRGVIERERDILAFAPLSPLSTTHWGIAIRQSEEEALAPARQLQTRLFLLGIVILLAAALLTWSLLQGVVKPIQGLISATKRVATGDFKAVAPLKRKDEIGQLNAAFYDMTQELARARDELVSLYEEAKQKEALRGQLFNYAISAREEERKRIARELHDEYGQTLTGLIMSIESLEDKTTKQTFNAKVENAKSIARRALEDLRRLTGDLRPSALDDLGLIAAIRAYIQRYLEAAGLRVKFESEGFDEDDRLSPVLETTLFRIVQEASHNVVKYANAREVRIQLQRLDSKVTVSIIDDGKGFEVESAMKSHNGVQHLGILGMKERTTLLGGTFEIESKSGQGTTINVEIPVSLSGALMSLPVKADGIIDANMGEVKNG